MFIAFGFPTSAREEGAELLYVGLVKSEMLEACETAAKTGDFKVIGKLERPIFRRHSLEKPVVTVVDCSLAHNAGLSAHRNALAAGKSPADAALIQATVKADAAKVFAGKAKDLFDSEVAKFRLLQKQCAEKIAAAPMNPNVAKHVESIEKAGNVVVATAFKAYQDAKQASDAAAEALQSLQAMEPAPAPAADPIVPIVPISPIVAEVILPMPATKTIPAGPVNLPGVALTPTAPPKRKEK